ncbi:THO complex subunit 2-like [Paramuricea clavata]|uniref:THO complex subunit 2-like n=1 Tax=Paramuricea clavata TaxID=317549 RepID=A0A7D9IXA8_PARCT|nr:THO complex subunit 2-like [Paramuricea clavata]
MAAVLIPPASLKSWEKGKATILKLCETFVANGTTAEAHGSDAESNYTQLFCELISNVVSGQIGHDEVVQLLAENIIVDDEERRSILADVISIMDVDSTFSGKSEQDRFTTFVSALVNMAVVSGDLLKERIDVETLDSLGLIQSTKGFNSKFVKIKTKLFYKQQKFNLLREESEGYSKLITELGQEMDSINHIAFLQNIKSLIGRFNLDPNRVLDIMLDAFEFHLEEEDFFITLLQDYSSNYDRSTVCHILGFKYQFYKDQPDVRPPHALLYLTALLIKYDLLELNDIYEYLSPSDAEINEDNTQELLDAKAEARKMNTAILTSDTNSEETKENEKEPKVEVCEYVQYQSCGGKCERKTC